MAKMEDPQVLVRASHPSLQRVANPPNEADGTSCSQCLQINQPPLPVIAVPIAFSGMLR